MRYGPPAAWTNGLHEAIERLRRLTRVPEDKGDGKALEEENRVCVRDEGALAYVLWRLRNEPDYAEDEPANYPGRMSAERLARLTPEERIFFGIPEHPTPAQRAFFGLPAEPAKVDE
ncbi:MAG: hypothetical protein ACHREM_04105 [Polyangiales bacterium]